MLTPARQTLTAAREERASTTVHINGGTLDDHADAKKLRRKAAPRCAPRKARS
jgi:hypothetical protein